MQLLQTSGYKIILDWLKKNERTPFAFQQQSWQHIVNGDSGLVNAPTGCGKTYSVFLGAIIQFINQHPNDYQSKKNNDLQLLWITPLRALAKDIARAMEEVIAALGMNWRIGIRNGDTAIKEREQQKKQMPEVLIITPESLHLLLAQKNYPHIFKNLKIIAVDEWHELLGSKRGVQTELAISRIINLPIERCSIWGISATIGNLEEAKQVLLSPLKSEGIIVKADLYKKTAIQSIFPDEIEKYPWAGHLGIKLVDKILPIINNSRTTLIFINTRGMTEMWYQALLTAAPELAGAVALHHGSIEQELRFWVEENLHTGRLKAVVCTASLDLGVDFRPVETIIQVGSPKGVARFLQRAGRSGHSPDATSKIYFLPTHSLELVEAAALKQAVEENFIESKTPFLLCFDVLIQYLCTLATGEGFYPDKIYQEIKNTFCFSNITPDEYKEMLLHITAGGKALNQYDEYKKVEILEGGLYKITSRRTAMRHRLHIGTIVSDAMLKVKFFSGGYIGVIEEWFISRLEPGDSFTIAGRNLELVMIKDMTVLVKKSTSKKSIIPSWMGGRMSLSSNLGKKLRESFDTSQQQNNIPELKILKPLFDLQNDLSHVPLQNELLIEHIETKDGFHLFVYPFEGRLVHEAMAAILAWRISKITPITFSFAMNDYGFELLSDQPIPLDDSNVYELFSEDNLFADIQKSVNSTEMAKRKFRDIAVIGGLIFQGMPGEKQKARHLQSSASLLFKVFAEYEPDNILLRQAYNEVFEQQMEEARLRDMLQRIQKSKIVITWPQQLTPFCFPLKVDSLRENISSEKLEDRVKRMQEQLGKDTK
ncbi:ligase-associated DNA damage response DEXH box helicase [Ferruginibacter sp.]|nr:ligase-associated DNA damage response DEXH box helicase [Ferruginibacter sp.]